MFRQPVIKKIENDQGISLEEIRDKQKEKIANIILKEKNQAVQFLTNSNYDPTLLSSLHDKMRDYQDVAKTTFSRDLARAMDEAVEEHLQKCKR